MLVRLQEPAHRLGRISGRLLGLVRLRHSERSFLREHVGDAEPVPIYHVGDVHEEVSVHVVEPVEIVHRVFLRKRCRLRDELACVWIP